jgi:hypothetical protein
MGEVYRARDSKLDRVVAVKVLPGSMASDKEALARFEREAKAVAALSHPNILAIFDFGTHDGIAYAAMELLEGENLRARLSGGPLPTRRAIDIAQQVCHGLGAAHEKGIVHRDLKPENLFITKDGRVKILDFGLAKVTRPAYPHERETMDLAPPNEPGTVMGTVGYMSPEQVRGEAADQRSDIFSFGSILYEMLSGKRAFRSDSAVETMSAILKHEPPDLVETNKTVNPALDRMVRRCLEKHAEARFQSARDLAFQLETISGLSSSSVAHLTAAGALPRATRRVPWPYLAIPLVLGLALGFAAANWPRAAAVETSFQQLTFRTGTISGARFAPDGETIVYSAAWKGRPIEILTSRVQSPESRDLELPKAGVLALSTTGEMAIALDCRFVLGACRGTLARVPLSGGAPRELLKDVRDADWLPDGSDLAILREVKGRQQIELPTGTALYQASGWLSHVRVSPKGDLVAFIDHPTFGDDAGAVTVVDRKGQSRTVSDGWSSAWGLAWHPSGDEIWLTAAERGLHQTLYAIDLAGRRRVVLRAPARLVLQDISRKGQVLLTREAARGGLVCLRPGETKEQDLSWLDWSSMAHLSNDGRTLLFGERGEGTHGVPTVYLRKTDGSAAVRLGEGRPLALSPDGAWALAFTADRKLVLLPTGAGEPRVLAIEPLVRVNRASWFPKANRVLLLGTEKGGPRRCYVLDLEKGPPRAIGEVGLEFFGDPIAPDETRFAALGANREVVLHPLESGAAQPVPGATPGLVPIQWSPDGRTLYLAQRESLPLKVYKLDLGASAPQLWKEIQPGDTTGIVRVPNVDISADGQAYTYTYTRRLGELYLATGLR